MGERIGETSYVDVKADSSLLLQITIFSVKPGELQDVKLSADEAAVSGNMALAQNLTLVAQMDLISIARQMLNEMEKNLMGGIGAAPGSKPVTA